MLALHIFFPHHVTCVNFIMLESRILKLTHVTQWGKKICKASILLLRYATLCWKEQHILYIAQEACRIWTLHMMNDWLRT